MTSPFGKPSFRLLAIVSILAALLALASFVIILWPILSGARMERDVEAAVRAVLAIVCLYAGWLNLRGFREMRRWARKYGPKA